MTIVMQALTRITKERRHVIVGTTGPVALGTTLAKFCNHDLTGHRLILTGYAERKDWDDQARFLVLDAGAVTDGDRFFTAVLVRGGQ